ncbi:MAG: hypothetical protein Unbinned1524contig1000_66 [Prokaryotic dsDNA virus sp.]|nr:MAG: hypothetical protein Unbinned1524contig1000_66 [Prokaryotic dsDNA virus sp.]|tara:strand:- start:2630 stop:2875 length:246 start_codon:yes stop_codon:yes gene_type:complete
MFLKEDEYQDWSLEKAMQNSYDVIIRQYDAVLIIEKGGGWFAHDPSSELELEDVLGVLEYYEGEEEFIKCKELNEFIKNHF